MGFIDSYKHLEKLCGELLNDNRCVSAYIDVMLNTPRGAYLVRGWTEDLKQLKHYRWIRNRIVHDPGCSEENMCRDGDTQWIESFYSRIMNQTDPLALYRKSVQPWEAPSQNQTICRYDRDGCCNNRKAERICLGLGISLWITIAVIAAVIIWLFLKG